MTPKLNVLAGHCVVSDGYLRVSHSAWRAVHPAYTVAMLTLLAITVQLFTHGPTTSGGRRYYWYHTFLLFLVVTGLVVYDLITYEVVSDKQIPTADINLVRLEAEQRRGYFKQTHTVPLVVIEYATGDGTATYPIHLHRRQTAYESELVELLDLFDTVDAPVVDDDNWLQTDSVSTRSSEAVHGHDA